MNNYRVIIKNVDTYVKEEFTITKKIYNHNGGGADRISFVKGVINNGEIKFHTVNNKD